MDIHEATAALTELAKADENAEEITEEITEDTEDTEDIAEDSEDISDEEISSEPETDVVDDEADAETVELEAEQLASLLALDEDRISFEDGVKFKAKVDGQVEDVTLEQLINAYQWDRTLTNRGKEISKLKEEQESYLQRLSDQTNQFAKQSAAVLEALKDRYTQPYSQEELKQLREDDPAEYAARKQEMKDRETEFSKLVSEAIGTVQTSQQTQSEEYQRQYRDYLAKEQEKTLKAIPDWGKSEKQVFEYAVSDLDFTAQELSMMADSRLLRAFHKAMLYDKGVKNAQTKQVRKIPKVVKGGARKGKDVDSLEMQQKLQQRFSQSGSVDDAVALLRAKRR